MTATSILDTSTIDATTFGQLRETTDAEFVGELIDTYCEETPRLLADLQASLARGDADAFRRAAHSIKSNSNSLGALLYAVQARDLEMLGKAGDLSGAEPRVEALLAGYQRVEEALQELKHGD
jgi:HPt (histidine-containing phosphotransfer) domain-containing protein